MAKKTPVITLSRESMEARISGGRTMLITAIVLTILNMIFVVLDKNMYFIFSVAASYYMVAFGKGMDNGFSEGAWSVNGTYTVTALVMSVIVLAIFFLCWYKSKTNHRWLTVGLVLFIFDTLVLIWVTLVMIADPGSNIVDLCIHLWILYIMGRAVNCSKKLKQLDLEEAIAAEAEAEEAEKYNGPSFDD